MKEYKFQYIARNLHDEMKQFCGGEAFRDFWFTLNFHSSREGKLSHDHRRLWEKFLLSLFGPHVNFDKLPFIVRSDRQEIYDYLFPRSNRIEEIPFEKILRLFRYCIIHHHFLSETERDAQEKGAAPIPREMEEKYFPFSGALESAPFTDGGGTFYGCPHCLDLKKLWREWGCRESSETAGLLEGDFTNKELLGPVHITCSVDPFHTRQRRPLPLEEIRKLKKERTAGSLCGENLKTVDPKNIDTRIRLLEEDLKEGRYVNGELDWLLAFAAPGEGGPESYADWVLEQFNTNILETPFRWVEPPDSLGYFDRSDFLIGRHWAGITRPLSLLNKRAGLFFKDVNNSFTVTICVDGTRRGLQPAALICAWETLANLHLFLDLWRSDDWSNLTLSFPCQNGEEVFDLCLIHGQEGAIMGDGYGGMSEDGMGLYMWLDMVAAALRSMRKMEKINNTPEFRALEERIDNEEIRGYEIAGELWEIASKYAKEEIPRNSYIQPLERCRDEWAAAEPSGGSG